MSGSHGAAPDVEAQLVRALQPVVEDGGLFLEGVRLAGAPKHRVVQVTVDLPDGPGGVGSDALAEVSRAVSTRLDEVDHLIAGAYLLEVSTPGVSRPLTDARHFRRAQGRLVDITTTTGRVSGRVRGVDDADVLLEADSGTVSVPLADVVRGRVEVELNRVADAQD